MIVSPTVPQFNYISSKAKFPAMVAGFGSGKTQAAVLRSLLGKIANPCTNRGFYLPTYDLVRQIAFPRFEAACEELKLPYKLLKSPLNELHIEGYGKIIFRNMDNPSRIVGYEHADCDIDELDTLKTDDAAAAWRAILARNRQNKPDKSTNTIGVTTTPEGFRFVYNQWKFDPVSGSEIIQAPTSSNPHLPDGYIENLKDQYPEQLLKAYLEGEFVNLTSGTVYHTFDRVRHKSDETIKQGEPLFIGLDFNVQNMSAVTHIKREGNPIAVDELIGLYDTPAMIEAIKDRYPKHKIYVYPDASGNARKTVDASVSDISLLKGAGFYVMVNKKNPNVRDRITCVNACFEKRNYKVNVSKCPIYTRSLEQQSYGKDGKPDKTQGDDHPNDAAGYFITFEYPIVRPVTKLMARSF